MSVTSEPELSYRSGGEQIPLRPDPRLLAVRYAPGGRDGVMALEARAASVIRRAANVSFIANHGVRILQVPDGADADALTLDRDGSVDFASPLVRVGGEDGPVSVVLPQVLAKFPDEMGRAEVDRVLATYGAVVIEARPFLGNAFVIRTAEGVGPDGPLAVANRLVDDGHALLASPDLLRRIEIRTLVEDQREVAEARAAFDSEQWHLDTAKVRAAWRETRGSGAVVAVLDDGIDVQHPEFAGKVRAQRNFDNGSDSAAPTAPDDNHGTACAGVAVAAGIKASGAAPEAGLVAARTPLWLGTSEEAEMFRWSAESGANVISCSWGPAQPYALPDITAEVLRWCAEESHGGKGCVILFAAGNESEDMTTDGYAASRHVLAVAATTDADDQAFYSDFGPEIDIAAPSNGGSKGIFTTDRRGADGYNNGDETHGDDGYTAHFGGTSSAAPLVAGVAALVRSANPALTASEVRDVLTSTAEKVGGPDEYDEHGLSNRFGHGRVDAAAAVQEAIRRLGGSTPTTLGPVGIEGPDSASRVGPPPVFVIDTGGRRFYSVEVAVDPELFDESSHGHRRTSATFFTSHDDGLESMGPYAMPSQAWSQLQHADRLHYRVIAANDANGTDFAASTPDHLSASAPSFPVLASGGGGAAQGGSVRFPSGAQFAAIDAPADGQDYSDPVANGIVSLIDTQGRTDERLSENFKLSEFVARGGRYRYARVSVDLVRGLQAMRTAAGASLTIRSAYRPPRLNSSVGGAARSQHLVGRAADIKIGGLSPLEVAELALEHLGADIGLGLGTTITHVDLRGTLATWTYSGAELSEQAFDDWARDHARRLGRHRGDRDEISDRDWPSISGPDSWSVGEPAPTFHIRSGRFRWFAVELATDPRLFWPAATGHGRTPGHFAATWTTGLIDAGTELETTCKVPEDVWSQMHGADRVFFRCLTAASQTSWDDAESSLALSQSAEAPSIRVTQSRRTDGWIDDPTYRRVTEARWNA